MVATSASCGVVAGRSLLFTVEVAGAPGEPGALEVCRLRLSGLRRQESGAKWTPRRATDLGAGRESPGGAQLAEAPVRVPSPCAPRFPSTYPFAIPRRKQGTFFRFCPFFSALAFPPCSRILASCLFLSPC